MITVRKYVASEDRESVASWWEAYGDSALPERMLPETGYLAHDGDKKVAAGWVYYTNSTVAAYEWMVTNPTLSMTYRSRGLIRLTMHILQEIRKEGAEYVFTTTQDTALAGILKRKFQFKYITKEHTLLRNLCTNSVY